jgi:hypothetical protein
MACSSGSSRCCRRSSAAAPSSAPIAATTSTKASSPSLAALSAGDGLETSLSKDRLAKPLAARASTPTRRGSQTPTPEQRLRHRASGTHFADAFEDQRMNHPTNPHAPVRGERYSPRLSSWCCHSDALIAAKRRNLSLSLYIERLASRPGSGSLCRVCAAGAAGVRR